MNNQPTNKELSIIRTADAYSRNQRNEHAMVARQADQAAAQNKSKPAPQQAPKNLLQKIFGG